MAQPFDIIVHTLGSAVANSGTFTVNYPTNKDAGAYRSGFDHKAATNAYGILSVLDNTLGLTFGTSSITVTNKSGGTLAAGTTLWIQLSQGQDGDPDNARANAEQLAASNLFVINLGAPDVADADGVSVSASVNSGVAGVIGGALAAGGVATFDVPRNVVGAWTTTAILTVTGTDQYGRVMRESSASGTTMAGKKAFKTVTGFTFNANVTGATVGSGDVLGLPVFLPGVARVIREIQDGAVATAGTVVTADLTVPATATTGDIRGTYDPNAACDGAKVFELIAAIDDPSFRGVAQFAG
jgi:hypothetical protein